MQAFAGQTVLTKGLYTSNGTSVQAAIVTRSWNTNDIVLGGTGTGLVNVSIIPDAGHHVIPHTSVTLYATEADGDAATAHGDHVRDGQHVAAKRGCAYFLPGTFPAE